MSQTHYKCNNRKWAKTIEYFLGHILPSLHNDVPVISAAMTTAYPADDKYRPNKHFRRGNVGLFNVESLQRKKDRALTD